MKVYTVEEVASILRVEYKTVLRLIKRGQIKVLPGIRHKRIPEAELARYLDVQNVLGAASQNRHVPNLPGATPPASGLSIKAAGNHKPERKIT